MQSKPDRIAAMEWRFNQYRIRFPQHRTNEYAISQLYFQVENFTMDLGLLRHDDAIDTLAMHTALVHRRGGGGHATANIKTPAELMLSGQLYDEETGEPNLLRVPPGQLTHELVQGLLRKRILESGIEQEREIDPWGAPYQWS